MQLMQLIGVGNLHNTDVARHRLLLLATPTGYCVKYTRHTCRHACLSIGRCDNFWAPSQLLQVLFFGQQVQHEQPVSGKA